jgi:hypothetical protein
MLRGCSQVMACPTVEPTARRTRRRLVSADHQATIDHGAVAGLLVYAARVAVTEWDQLGGRGGDYCLDSVARTVEDTLAALVAYDMDRARRLVGLAEVQYIDGFVRGLVTTHEEPFSD